MSLCEALESLPPVQRIFISNLFVGLVLLVAAMMSLPFWNTLLVYGKAVSHGKLLEIDRYRLGNALENVEYFYVAGREVRPWTVHGFMLLYNLSILAYGSFLMSSLDSDKISAILAEDGSLWLINPFLASVGTLFLPSCLILACFWELLRASRHNKHFIPVFLWIHFVVTLVMIILLTIVSYKCQFNSQFDGSYYWMSALCAVCGLVCFVPLAFVVWKLLAYSLSCFLSVIDSSFLPIFHTLYIVFCYSVFSFLTQLAYLAYSRKDIHQIEVSNHCDEVENSNPFLLTFVVPLFLFGVFVGNELINVMQGNERKTISSEQPSEWQQLE